MIRSFIFLFLILFAHNLSAQTYNSLTTDDEIENFIKFYISDSSTTKNKKKYCKNILPLRRGDFTISNSKNIGSIYFLNSKLLDSILTESDKLFFIQQVDSIKTKEWRVSKLNFKKKIRKQKKCSFISVPIFSLNKKYAIIQRLTSCSYRFNCVGVYLYEATNGGWKLCKTLMSHFVSISHNKSI